MKLVTSPHSNQDIAIVFEDGCGGLHGPDHEHQPEPLGGRSPMNTLNAILVVLAVGLLIFSALPR